MLNAPKQQNQVDIRKQIKLQLRVQEEELL